VSGGWTLTDCYECDELTPLTITSSQQLRRELEQLATLEPRIATLETPSGKFVRIGIGGPWSGFGVIEHLPQGIRLSKARGIETDAPKWVEFLCGRQPCLLQAMHLSPTREIIDLVVGYFETGDFPDSIVWDKL
jgi:hypothetical protein